MEPFFRRNRKSSYTRIKTALRALQERKNKPVGSNKEIAVDIRIITATNEDLREAVKKGDLEKICTIESMSFLFIL
jgi:transcriptional regulator with AAA-type ATPase domain